MSHLNRIFLKRSQVRNFGPALPHCAFRRCYAHKKILGLKFYPSSSFEQDWKDRNPSSPVANEKESKNKFGRANEFYPKINQNLLKGIKSIAGISITPYGVGWSRIDLKQKRLTNFGNVLLSLNQNKYPHPPITVFKVAKATQMALPEADLYILENFRSSRDKNHDITEIQLISMLTVLLNTTTNGDQVEDRVFFQNRSVINYLFELSIKNERTSAGQKLQRVLNEIAPLGDNELSDDIVADWGDVKLSLKSEFVNVIFSSRPLQRDLTAVAFFLAVSFIEMNKEKLCF